MLDSIRKPGSKFEPLRGQTIDEDENLVEATALSQAELLQK